MSINHYSSLDLPETTLWWTQNPQQQQQQQIQIMEPIPNPSWSLHHHKNLFNLNNNNEEEELLEEQQQDNNNEQATTTTTSQEGVQEEEEEPMFEKPLTPSDVGKLNRLVIPKQHAEKYFPLSAASGSTVTSSDSGECKGLLLSFEDESGKCWRFRYSYWNSSQSYVLTKGWSRYVKDKRLDAGDIVSFQRHRGDSQRLFIKWRRRCSAGTAVATALQVSRAGHGGSGGGDGNNGKSGGGGGGVGWTSGFYCAHPSYPTHHHQQHEGLHAGKGCSQGLNQRTRPTTLGNCSSSSSSSSKVLRLFGVNMECQPQHDDDDSTPECSYNNNVAMPSTQGADDNTNHQNLYHNVINHHQPPNSYSNSHMVHQQPYYY